MKKYYYLTLGLLILLGAATKGNCEAEKSADSSIQISTIISDVSGKVDNFISSSKKAIEKKQTIEAEKLGKEIAERWNIFTNKYKDSDLKSPENDSVVETVTKQIEQGISFVRIGKIKNALDAFEGVKLLINKLPSIGKLPVLMDFTGFRCKNCKIMEKRINNISGNFKGRARITFVDVNKEKDLVRQYKISLIPTLVFLNRDGKEVCRKTGVMEEKAIKTKLEELVREE